MNNIVRRLSITRKGYPIHVHVYVDYIKIKGNSKIIKNNLLKLSIYRGDKLESTDKAKYDNGMVYFQESLEFTGTLFRCKEDQNRFESKTYTIELKQYENRRRSVIGTNSNVFTKFEFDVTHYLSGNNASFPILLTSNCIENCKAELKLEIEVDASSIYSEDPLWIESKNKIKGYETADAREYGPILSYPPPRRRHSTSTITQSMPKETQNNSFKIETKSLVERNNSVEEEMAPPPPPTFAHNIRKFSALDFSFPQEIIQTEEITTSRPRRYSLRTGVINPV